MDRARALWRALQALIEFKHAIKEASFPVLQLEKQIDELQAVTDRDLQRKLQRLAEVKRAIQVCAPYTATPAACAPPRTRLSVYGVCCASAQIFHGSAAKMLGT